MSYLFMYDDVIKLLLHSVVQLFADKLPLQLAKLRMQLRALHCLTKFRGNGSCSRLGLWCE